jgi:hypothetical protein
MTAQHRPDEEAALWQAVAGLEEIVSDLCRRLQSFPAFLGMTTIQAIELDPTPAPVTDAGCVVLTPDGVIAELDVTVIPGVVGVLEVDQVEEFRPLELPVQARLIYLTEAVRVLAAEIARRDG